MYHIIFRNYWPRYSIAYIYGFKEQRLANQNNFFSNDYFRKPYFNVYSYHNLLKNVICDFMVAGHQLYADDTVKYTEA